MQETSRCSFNDVCLSVCLHVRMGPQALLPAAGLLQLSEVKKACCDFLSSQLHPSNCLGIRAFADLHACCQLLTQANSYAGECGRRGETAMRWTG